MKGRYVFLTAHERGLPQIPVPHMSRLNQTPLKNRIINSQLWIISTRIATNSQEITPGGHARHGKTNLKNSKRSNTDQNLG